MSNYTLIEMLINSGISFIFGMIIMTYITLIVYKDGSLIKKVQDKYVFKDDEES